MANTPQMEITFRIVRKYSYQRRSLAPVRYAAPSRRMPMRNCLFWILFSFIWLTVARGKSLPYFSPGITLSLNFQGEFILSPKLSFGVYGDSRFYNITFGRSSGGSGNIYPHYFIEGQFGKLTPPSSPRRTQIFWGGGLGITIPQLHKSDVSLRCTAFTGNIVFLNFTALFRDTVCAEIGPQFVLPIPLRTIDFGSIGD
jgi:hypothetical protein